MHFSYLGISCIILGTIAWSIWLTFSDGVSAVHTELPLVTVGMEAEGDGVYGTRDGIALDTILARGGGRGGWITEGGT